MNTLVPVASLWRREIVRFLRQPNRVVGAVGSPLLFWLLIGSGVGRSFQTADGGESYLEYIFPGTLLMILLFTAIFSTISIIEDRKEGFLQAVLVSPLPRSGVVLSKLLGGTTLAFGQAAMFLVLAPVAGISIPWLSLIPLALMLWLVGMSMTALGFILAWRMNSVQGFHAIMNLLLLPLWVLSGALFPVSGAAGWLQWIMRLNPLTYGLDAIRTLMGSGGEGPDLWISAGITLLFAVGLFGASTWIARSAGDVA